MNFLDSLAPAEREAFSEVATEESFPRGFRIMSEGEPANHVIVILGGWTRITVRSGGGERIVAERGPGQLVGERAALRPHVRSATVTALTEVRALMMKTEDFASFIASDPRVLEVVEDQIYNRLTEYPEDYGQRGGPGALSRSEVSDALRARLQSQTFAGENCTVLLTDVVDFGAPYRKDYDREVIRSEGLKIMRASLGPLWDTCDCADRGDGLLIVVGPQIPTARIIEKINRDLSGKLRLHNRTFGGSARIHLRVAVTAGPVTSDPLGPSGETIIHAARLADAPVLKEAMADTDAGLGILVADFVYDWVIGSAADFAEAPEYKKVKVRNKEFTGRAWMRLTNLSSPAPDPLRAGGGVREQP